MVSIFFLNFVLIIFFCSSLSFFFFTGFNWRLQRHAYEICRSSIHFCCGYLFFWFLKLTGIFLYVFSKDLMVSLVDLIFQVCKCLKWRVHPQTSFLSSKKLSLEMLFLFFLHFICSSSSVHHVCFVYRLQLTLKKTCIWDLPFISPFSLWISFFLVSQANWYFSLCFLQRSNGFFAWSYFSVCKCLKWRVQPQTSFLSSKNIESGDAFSIFLTFHLFIFFCSSCLFCLQASTDA